MISAPKMSDAPAALSSSLARARALAPASLLALAFACACSSDPDSIVDRGTAGNQDSGSQPGHGDGDAFGNGDGDDGVMGDGDSCAWADARPVAKSPVVWLALDPQMLKKKFLGADGADDGINADALRPVLFGPKGLVSRMEHFVRFGLSAYGMTAAFSECAQGTVVPAALDNASVIAAAYESFSMNDQFGAPANWASLEAVATEIAKQNGSFRNAVLLITQTVEGALCPDQWGGDSIPRVRAAVDALADKDATVSVVTFLNVHVPEQNPAAIARDAALAKAGGGKAFAGTDGDELIAAVQRFVEEGVSCEVALEGEVKAGEVCSGDVQLGDQKLACNDADGFKLKDASTLELTGKACDDLRSKSGLTIRARFPCESFVIY